ASGVAWTTMDPPRPPSPPSGPPRGTKGSRRKETAPAPPCPARTRTRATSTNAPWSAAAPPAGTGETRLAGGPGFGDRDAAAVLAHALEDDLAVDQGEEAVVAGLTDAHAGLDMRAALADDDRAHGHDLAAVRLDAQLLRVGVAAVAGGAAALLVRHLRGLLRGLRLGLGRLPRGASPRRLLALGLVGLALRLLGLLLSPGGADADDLERRQVGAGAAVDAHALLRLVADDVDLGAAPVPDHPGRDRLSLQL